MSSLLQFRGTTSKRGVDLRFTHIRKFKKACGDFSYDSEEYTDTFTDPTTGRQLPYIWIATRKPVGMFGCWVVFRYNGEEHVPNLSCPITVERIPRDARKLSMEESLKIWHT